MVLIESLITTVIHKFETPIFQIGLEEREDPTTPNLQ